MVWIDGKRMGGKRTRTIEYDEPVAPSAGSVRKTGLEQLRDVVTGTSPPAPIESTLGFRLVEVSDGLARLLFEPAPHLYNSEGAVHGGVAVTLLESAMSAAVLSTLDAVTSHASATSTTHFTRAISPRMLKITAEGWVVHRGSRLATAEARLHDEQGRLLAHGSATFTLTSPGWAGAGPTSVRGDS
jgi:uncharacterized protein (TIGR00369 family)